MYARFAQVPNAVTNTFAVRLFAEKCRRKNHIVGMEMNGLHQLAAARSEAAARSDGLGLTPSDLQCLAQEPPLAIRPEQRNHAHQSPAKRGTRLRCHQRW